MSLYAETVSALKALSSRAASGEDVLFCERRPLTSLEAALAGSDRLAGELRAIEDEALRRLERLVEAEHGYETALQAIDAAGAEPAEWLRAVLLARALERLQGSAPG